MLEILNFSAGYPGQPVLQDISLTIPSGTVTVIAGPNGCGKSTLLKALAGILTPKGSVKLDGQELLTLPPKMLAQKIAYLPQSRQVPEITARRLVLHGRFPYLSYPRQYRQEDYAIADSALAQMGISHLAHRSLPTLSGGQRQKAYIAMALAQDTPVVLLDEPTSFLDISHQMQLMQHARLLAGSGKTVVLVLHDLAMALEWAGHLVILSEGRTVAQGSGEEVFRSGCLKNVFGVDVDRIRTMDGWKYYYR